MEKSRPKSPFASVTHVHPGEVRMTESALARDNGALRDLMIGEWSFGQHNSVEFDESSRRLFVSSHDQRIDVGSTRVLANNPAVARVSGYDPQADDGGVTFIANMAHMNHLLYRKQDIGLDDWAQDGHRLDSLRSGQGALLLGGVVLRHFDNELHYIGEPQYQQQAADFTTDLDRYAQIVALRDPDPQLVPSMKRRISDSSYDPGLRRMQQRLHSGDDAK